MCYTECTICKQSGVSCLGNDCKSNNAQRYYCNCCGEEMTEIEEITHNGLCTECYEFNKTIDKD